MHLRSLARYYWRHRYAGTLNRTRPVLGALQYRVYRSRVERIPLPPNPVFVLGHWRTGTTLLHELLALDPAYRTPSTYEALYAPHFLLTERWFKEKLRKTTGTVRPQDAMAFDLDLPQEDEFAILCLGAPSPYAMLAPIYTGTARAFDAERLIRTLEVEGLPPDDRRLWTARWTYFLRCLLLRRPGRLLLKSPSHTYRVPLLERLFPEARYVYMVREPLATIVSAQRTFSTFLSLSRESDEQILAESVKLFARLHERMEVVFRTIPPERIVTVRYEDLVADPERHVARVYEHLQLPPCTGLTEAVAASMRMRAGYRPNRFPIPESLAGRHKDHWLPYARRHGYV